MISSRRGFMRLLGALPLAGQNAAAALHKTGISSLGLGSYVNAISAGEGQAGLPTSAAPSAWVIANGLPGFVKDSLRTMRRVPNGLDPDLASNRSFSLSAKVRIQRERDLDRAVADTIEQQRINLKRAAFKKTTGVDLWW